MSVALENAVGSLIGNQAQGIITLVLSRLNEEIKLVRDFRKNELQELQEKLTELNKLVAASGNNNNNNNNNNELLSNWLKKVKNAAYEVDDLLDLHSYEALKRRNRTRKRDKLRKISYAVDMISIAHKAKDLRARINGIYMDGQRLLGINPMELAAENNNNNDCSTQSQQLKDHRQWVDYQDLVGRERDLTQVIELVCEPSNFTRSLTVVGIVGFPGLGKTSLSKRVTMTQEVMRHFNSNIIWLVVSHCYCLVDVLKKMIELLCKTFENITSTEAMVKKLEEKLKGMRYFLILDDVWDTIDWEPLIRVLKQIGGSKGTTLLVTSRDRNVFANIDAYGLDKAIIHQLERLNDEDSWSLFVQRASGDGLVTGEKQKIGRRIVKRCGGVPLAIRAIGNLLRNKGVDKWRQVEENEEWNKEQSDILPSLKLSFIYLPSMALKKCFSFCAIFRENEMIDKDKLIQMWMAQGFLQPYEKMELVGEAYIDVLLNNSFFQEPKLDQFGNVIAFKMHDLVLYLARITCGEECLNSQERRNLNDSLTNDVRHLSTSVLPRKAIISAKYSERLRTYYNPCPQFQNQVPGDLTLFLEHFSCLRVLCLPRLCLEDLPKSLKKLKLLRYLDISHNCFATLPDVITQLYHLQTLRIDYNLKREVSCHLPHNKVTNLVKLRHIMTESVEIGILKGIGHLTALQTLSTINLKSNWGGEVSELSSLTNLKGKLGIRGLECMKSKLEARSMNLGRLLGVNRLALEWSEGLQVDGRSSEILQGLEPHNKLATLDIAHYNGSKMPGWLTEAQIIKDSQRFSELVSLTLRHCFYATGNLNLGNLGSLRFLSIDSCYELTISLPENGFQCCNLLESLKFNSCILVGHVGDLSPLTRLHHLEIINCAKTTYELEGLDNLPCLEEVITDRLLPRDLCSDSAICKSLRSLYLSTQTDRGNLPNQLQHLVALQKLHIYGFKGLESLPEWLGKLTSLSLLDLSSLPRLERLPSEDVIQLLSKLKDLSIRECPSLKKQFTAKNGEWFKINHIPSIIADFQPLDNTVSRTTHGVE